jgi:hypothetical protein
MGIVGVMTNFAQLLPADDPSSQPVDPLRLAVPAYLARFTGMSRTHALSDLRIFLAWCAALQSDAVLGRHGMAPRGEGWGCGCWLGSVRGR